MDANALIAELRSLIEGARSMPMSTSAVVNRAEALDLIARLEGVLAGAPSCGPDAVPDGDGSAQSLNAQRAIADADREFDRRVSESEVFRVAKIEADKERRSASREAAELRQQADDYVDTRLATFEITLTRTLEAVSRGRARLQGRSHFAELAPDADGDEPAEGAVPPAAESPRAGGGSDG